MAVHSFVIYIVLVVPAGEKSYALAYQVKHMVLMLQYVLLPSSYFA